MRLITDVFADLEGGRALDDMNGALDEVTRAVAEYGKVGTLTIKLTVRPNGENSISITPDIKAKAPEAARGASVYFVTGGGITRSNPNQPDLPLKEVVDNTAGELKEAK